MYWGVVNQMENTFICFAKNIVVIAHNGQNLTKHQYRIGAILTEGNYLKISLANTNVMT